MRDRSASRSQASELEASGRSGYPLAVVLPVRAGRTTARTMEGRYFFLPFLPFLDFLDFFLPLSSFFLPFFSFFLAMSPPLHLVIGDSENVGRPSGPHPQAPASPQLIAAIICLPGYLPNVPRWLAIPLVKLSTYANLRMR